MKFNDLAAIIKSEEQIPQSSRENRSSSDLWATKPTRLTKPVRFTGSIKSLREQDAPEPSMKHSEMMLNSFVFTQNTSSAA